MSFEPIVLAPEIEPEEIYPYRRVWRTAWLEVVTLLLAVVVIYFTSALFDLAITSTPAKLGIAVLPLGAWIVFSYRGERRALQPRRGLFGVLILGGLVANGIAVPLEQRLFLTDQWLPDERFFGRIIGYTLTLGFSAEFLKYAVLRYTFWPERFQQRLDGIAYALAVSVGYAVVLNVRFALYTDATLSATALRVASITFSHLGIGIIMGLFLAELRIGQPPPVFWLPVGLLIAAGLSGAYYSFRVIAVVSDIGVGATGSSPFRGLLLAFGVVAALFIAVAFVVENADARMEALTGSRQTL
ncbi:MAG: PrsW family intramembrane metalloprotease [Chloroflexi bacterium]|nr:PrsW family intramembrane metalloprotease [Chloroflexota bacterium]